MCPAIITSEILKGKWRTSILYVIIIEKVKNFGEILKSLTPMNRGVLSRELNALEKDGIINKKIISKSPLRTEYNLTPFGESLCNVLLAMYNWGSDNADSKE